MEFGKKMSGIIADCPVAVWGLRRTICREMNICPEETPYLVTIIATVEQLSGNPKRFIF